MFVSSINNVKLDHIWLCKYIWENVINLLSASFTKWSNTLKQFVGKLPTNCFSVFDHFVGLTHNYKKLKSQRKSMWQSKEIKQNWKEPKLFDIYFFVIFNCFVTKLIYLEERFGSRLCLQPTLRVSWYFLVT